MNVSVVSNFQSLSEGFAEAGLAANFMPPFGGTLSVSANLSLPFSWWVNAIQDLNGALYEAVVVFGILQEQNGHNKGDGGGPLFSC
jgi:hypothetical protein